MPYRIFLLEDDPSIVRIVRATLGSADCEVLAHGQIAGALQAFAAFRADLALLDVMLPDGEGFQVCEEIRADPAFRDVPIIFTTSRGSLEDRLRGFRAGAQDYIHKPFDTPELVARVRAHLAQRVREDGLRHEAEAATARERIHQDVFDMIIHDLRTPLTSMKVSLDMLRDGALIDAATHARVEDISHRSLDQAMLMIDDLLDLKSRDLKVQRQSVDLEALFEKLRRMFLPQLERHGAGFQSLVAEDARQVCSDPSLLFRILVNLINNACKYASRGKSIELRASRGGPALRCEVLDRGPGIPDAEKELIFEKLYRTRAAKAGETVGSGIGLAFCRLAAQALGGSVRVRDREGGGSCFVLEVPAAEPSAPAPAAAATAAALLEPELIREFLADCAAQLRQIQDGLRAGQGPLSLDEIRALARAAHQFAGAAGTYGFPQAGATAARLESSLRTYMAGKATDSGGLRAETLQAFDSVRAQLEPPAPAQAAAGAVAEGAPCGKRALVCDDDPRMARLIEHVLRKLGFEALVAGDGEQGLALVRAQRPALLIMDLDMPVKDGIGVLRDLQAEAGPRPYTIVLSAHQDPETRERVLALGAHEVMVKPFPPAVLQAKLADLSRAGKF